MDGTSDFMLEEAYNWFGESSNRKQRNSIDSEKESEDWEIVDRDNRASSSSGTPGRVFPGNSSRHRSQRSRYVSDPGINSNEVNPRILQRSHTDITDPGERQAAPRHVSESTEHSQRTHDTYEEIPETFGEFLGAVFGLVPSTIGAGFEMASEYASEYLLGDLAHEEEARKARSKALADEAFNDLLAEPGDAVFLMQESDLITPAEVRCMMKILPKRLIQKKWHKAYSTFVNGYSMNTLFRHLANVAAPCVTIIKDDAGHRFGCFTSDPWHPSRQQYYGTGECFCFTLGVEQVQQEDEVNLTPYRWTGSKEYFMAADENCLMFGGGGEGFAIFLDHDLFRGTSRATDVFDNPCLASAEEFQCSAIEVWVLERESYQLTNQLRSSRSLVAPGEDDQDYVYNENT